MKMKTSTLAAAVMATLAWGAAGQAGASIYAGSSLDVQNLEIDIIGLHTIGTFQFTATNTATLNGVSDATQQDDCGGTIGANDCAAAPPRVNAPAANAPGGDVVRADNDYGFFGPGAFEYSNSNSEITTAELTGDPFTSTRQIAEAELQDGATASANAEITSSTGFEFTFTLAETGSLTLDFEANPSLMVQIMQGLDFSSGIAQANVNATFSLTQDATGDSVTWSPQGTAANDCTVDPGLIGVICIETADGQDLNRNLSVSSNNTTAQYSRNPDLGFTLFGIEITGLSAGNWTLALNAVTSVSMRQQLQAIPEPGTLALLGIGLAGLGAVSRRRKLAM